MLSQTRPRYCLYVKRSWVYLDDLERGVTLCERERTAERLSQSCKADLTLVGTGEEPRASEKLVPFFSCTGCFVCVKSHETVIILAGLQRCVAGQDCPCSLPLPRHLAATLLCLGLAAVSHYQGHYQGRRRCMAKRSTITSLQPCLPCAQATSAEQLHSWEPQGRREQGSPRALAPSRSYTTLSSSDIPACPHR